MLSVNLPIVRRQTIGDILQRTAIRLPNKTAIVCGSTVWSYAEFDQIVNKLAAGLVSIGVDQGDKVAILARNSHGFAALRFALARCGAVLVPINFMLKADEVAFILKHAGVKVLATDSNLAELAYKSASLDTLVEEFIWLPSEDESQPVEGMYSFDSLILTEARLPSINYGSNDLAQIVYTSGTESSPKGAMLTHDAVLWQYVSCVIDAEIDENDIILHALPLYHCAQLDVFLGPAIYMGSTNYITSKPVPEKLIPIIENNKISSFFAPPTVWISLLRSNMFNPEKLKFLKKAYYGASIMPIEVMKEILTRLPYLRLWNLYGQTEIAPLATILGPEDQLRKLGSCGKAARNVQTRVVDERMQDVRPGEIGEIVHRSPHLMLGYYLDDERSRSAFEGEWFHSGDLATIDEEGYITVVDRKKDMIKTGGENVASREVEEMIYRMPQVSEVAVIGLPDSKWVEIVTAIVVVKAGHNLDETMVISHCNQFMAHFKSPKKVIFTENLPKNPSGKLLKRLLRQMYS